MGGRFVSKEVVIQADWWDEDETVTIREVSYGAQQDMMGRLLTDGVGRMKVGELSKMKPDEKEIVVSEINFQTVLSAIVTWTLKDDDGEVVPVSDESIRNLTKADGNFITEAVNELNPVRDEDFQD